MYYLNSRYYDPETGRFINADGYVSTGQDLAGHNMFAYCGNNPVNRADPTGSAWIYRNREYHYDGSVVDFIRSEHGQPPAAYEADILDDIRKAKEFERQFEEYTQKLEEAKIQAEKEAAAVSKAISTVEIAQSRLKQGNKPEYNESGPWCVAFARWAANSAGVNIPTGDNPTSTGATIDHYKAAGRYVSYPWDDSPHPGDFLFIVGHTAIVESVNGNMITTIDGNWHITGDSGFVVNRRKFVLDKNVVGYGNNWGY